VKGAAALLLKRAIEGAVHDLRHPVTIIEGQRQLLGEGLLGPVTPAMTEALSALERQTYRMTEILAELEAVVLSEPGEIERFDLALVVEEEWRALFDQPPPRLPSTPINGDRRACSAMLNEILSCSGSNVVVGLGEAPPTGVAVSVRGPSGGPLDGLVADVLWYSRVVARRHGGHVTISGREGSGTELRVRLRTGAGTKTGPV
jgi:signal transduction histidine kinase